MSEETKLFEATCDTNVVFFKTIIEIVSQIMSVEKTSNSCNKSLKQLCFKINEHGMTFFPSEQNILISSIELKTSFFSSFEYAGEPLCIGVALDILKMCFKYVSRTDKLKITISKNEMGLYPSVMTFCFNETKGFVIRLNIVQNVFNDFNLDDFTALTQIQSSKLPNLYREVGGVKKQVNFHIKPTELTLSSTMVDIAETWASFSLLKGAENFFDTRFCLRSDFLKILSKFSIFDANVKLFYKQDFMLAAVCDIEKIKNKYTGTIIIGLKI